MRVVLSPEYEAQKSMILDLIRKFDQEGEECGPGKRNTVKVFPTGNPDINIKKFQIPIFLNRVAYRFFRKSKAQRSFEYGRFLLEKGFSTPDPIGYAEEPGGLLFKSSYYICEHIYPDLVFNDLIDRPDFPQRETIVREFTRMTFRLHEHGIELLDHSPHNTLIIVKEPGKRYDFFLIDLNRMKFRKGMKMKTRLKNFSRVAITEEIAALISEEYARLSGMPYQEVFDSVWSQARRFIRLKKKKELFKKKVGIAGSET